MKKVFLLQCVPIFLLLLFSHRTVYAQDTVRVFIPNISIVEGTNIVDVPVHIDYPDSLAGIQLALSWPSIELEYDTIIFGEVIPNSFSTIYNLISDEEIRVVIGSLDGTLEQLSFPNAPIAFSLRFQVTDKFNGNVQVEFVPEFRNISVTAIPTFVPTTVSGGTITFSDTTTSITGLPEVSPITLFPNPATDEISLSGLAQNQPYRLVLYDQLGRPQWRYRGFGLTHVLPSNIPAGTYWLRVAQGDERWVKPLVIRRH